MRTRKPYIVVMRDDHMYLVGPFESQEELAEWGNNPKNNPTDDPRWQSIELAHYQIRFPLHVLPPDEASQVAKTGLKPGMGETDES